MEFDKNIPIHLQLVNEFKRQIVLKEINGGDKMKSVRELAEEMNVNPNTMQKALASLETLGLVYTERTSGRFVTTNESVIQSVKTEMVEAKMSEFVLSLTALGFRGNQMVELLEKYLEGVDFNE